MVVTAIFTLDDSLVAQARAAVRKAAGDPLFIADVIETAAYFANVDREGIEE